MPREGTWQESGAGGAMQPAKFGTDRVTLWRKFSSRMKQKNTAKTLLKMIIAFMRAAKDLLARD